MTAIYLLRHGEPDFTRVRELNWPGPAVDLAPLSDLGIQQALDAADGLAHVGATALVASPMTRALQTASLVGHRLGLRVDVRFDLREWLPDEKACWTSYAEVKEALSDLERCDGEWPPGERRGWEPLSDVRARATAALRSQIASAGLGNDDVLIAACHGIVIWSLTGERHTGLAQWRRFDLT